MGKEALRFRDDGTELIPQTREEWKDWVSPTRTRNWMMDDPLLDWLEEFGRADGYYPRRETPGYYEDLDFVQFIMDKGNKFEAAIVDILSRQHEVLEISKGGLGGEEPGEGRRDA